MERPVQSESAEVTNAAATDCLQPPGRHLMALGRQGIAPLAPLGVHAVLKRSVGICLQYHNNACVCLPDISTGHKTMPLRSFWWMQYGQDSQHRSYNAGLWVMLMIA